MNKERALQIIGWMGGSNPSPVSEITTRERKLVRSMFRGYCKEWLNFWGPDTKLPKDIAKGFWIWARYDAHAMVRP